MIYTLVEHSQMIRKTKGVALKVHVLVGEDGSVIVPQRKVMEHEKFAGGGIASFEIRPEDCEGACDFLSLVEYVDRTMHMDPEKVMHVLQNANTLTVRHLIQQLSITREVAKIFIMHLVKCKAYNKYFSYWKRSKEFTVWLLTYNSK